MIPKYEITDIVVKKYPSKTYRLNNESINGFVDGKEALEQAVYCILSTQKYIHAIYSRSYGIDKIGYIGKNVPLVYSDIQNDITKALLKDDRINSVDGFSFKREGKSITVTFTVTGTEKETVTSEVTVDV